MRCRQALAGRRKASVVFVQAHAEDLAAIELYRRLGRSEEVCHLEIEPRVGGDPG